MSTISANCHGLLIDDTVFHTVNGVLTTMQYDNVDETVSACGLLLDNKVFAVKTGKNGREHIITSVNAGEEYPKESFLPSCYGVLIDSEYFELNQDGALTMKNVAPKHYYLTINSTPEGATITVKNNGTIIQAEADNPNKFEIDDPNLTYTYEVKLVGYETEVGTVKGGKDSNIDIKMKKIVFLTFDINKSERPNVSIVLTEQEKGEQIPPTENEFVFSTIETCVYDYRITDNDKSEVSTGSVTMGDEDQTITPVFESIIV